MELEQPWHAKHSFTDKFIQIKSLVRFCNENGFFFLTYNLTSALHSEKWIQRFNNWQQQSFKNNLITKRYASILEEENDLLFTHQRPPFIATN
jgi:hypothetical protein